MSLLSKGTGLGLICNFYYKITIFIFLQNIPNIQAPYKLGGKKRYFLFAEEIFEHQINQILFGFCQLLRTAGSPVVGGANAQAAISLAGAHLLSSLFLFQQISSSECKHPN